jgi:CubicO group peptidase (beta-lactamase class C family)/D-alanyl-D-alanine dipeptidase
MQFPLLNRLTIAALVLAATLHGSALLAAPPTTPPSAAAPSDARYTEAIAVLDAFVAHEVADKQLPALSLALVDDQHTVWAKGYGLADPSTGTPATAETTFRVGSVSKLFTDLAIMQLVEQGRLDLDAPVTRYLPEFKPRNPFGGKITLRQLMSHRAGLVREPPVGHYFDPAEPSVEQTVASLNETELVYAPESRTKYSNAGITVAGYVLERAQGVPFAQYLKQAVLEPLGLRQSSFAPTPGITNSLATAYMWTVDGRTNLAPTFQLGISPAGSLYTTVSDLARFLSVLFAGGQGPAGALVKPSTLELMWTPQFARPGQKDGFGIGFHIYELEGHRAVGHDGAIYGFATTLNALPGEKLGAVAVTTMDCANAVTDRIVEAALKALLAVKAGKPVPRPETTEPVSPEAARRAVGRYTDGARSFDLTESNGALSMFADRGGFQSPLKSLAGTLVTDGRLNYGQRFTLRDGLLIQGTNTYRRVPRSSAPPPPPPPGWAGLIGEYGWDHDILYILERDGKLWALIEWFFAYPLERVSEDVFRFPAYGLYDGERLIFTRDARGRATAVQAANVMFKRRAVEPEQGTGQLRIQPLRPVSRLLEEARSARPPEEKGDFRRPDLVELTRPDPTIKLEIRYATTNNFLGSVFYAAPRAFMQRPAAEALVRAHHRLREQGYGLLIYDAYRPWFVTKVFWDATPADKKWMVANPAEGSKHNRGAAVDLSLYDLKTGAPVPMVSTYDESTDRAFADYPGGESVQRWHRRLLRDAMEAEGFSLEPVEWWHFNYRDWPKYPIGNVAFEALSP